MPLYRHLDDAACTAAMLWDSWLPENARRIIAEPFRNGDDDGLELARKLAIFVAAGHNIAFRLQRRRNRCGMRWHWRERILIRHSFPRMS